MSKRIRAYIGFVEMLLLELEAGKGIENLEKIKAEHLIQIGFFQHERLIHLIVTVLFAIIEFMSFFAFLVLGTPAVLALTVAILILLIPYIKHYYLLENEVQKMYGQYDRMCALQKQNTFSMV